MANITYLLVLKFFSFIFVIINCLNCDIYINEPNLQYTTWKDLENCLSTIGKNELNLEVATNIWKLIKKAYDDVIHDIPKIVYTNMGYILAGINLNDLRNISFDDISIIKIFGSSTGMRNEQLKVIAEKIQNDWVLKSPETYSEYDLKALGKILCFMNQSDILNIHPDAFREAAITIGGLQNCSIEILQAFAKLAVQPEAFGPPSKWSKFDVEFVGRVILGLSPDEYQSINQDSLKVNKGLYAYLNATYRNTTEKLTVQQ